MEKITKNVIIEKLADINSKLELAEKEKLSYTYDCYGVYGVYQNGIRIVEGKAKEVYCFLLGFESADSSKYKKVNIKRNRVIEDFVKNQNSLNLKITSDLNDITIYYKVQNIDMKNNIVSFSYQSYVDSNDNFEKTIKGTCYLKPESDMNINMFIKKIAFLINEDIFYKYLNKKVRELPIIFYKSMFYVTKDMLRNFDKTIGYSLKLQYNISILLDVK